MKISTGGTTLELRPRQPRDAEDWVRVRVVLTTNGFTGDFDASLQLDDLTRFADQLREMYEQPGTPCQATLGGLEPGIHLDLTMQSTGSISGAYALENADAGDPPTRLTGGFHLDQSYLPEIMRSIEALIAALRED